MVVQHSMRFCPQLRIYVCGRCRFACLYVRVVRCISRQELSIAVASLRMLTSPSYVFVRACSARTAPPNARDGMQTRLATKGRAFRWADLCVFRIICHLNCNYFFDTLLDDACGPSKVLGTSQAHGGAFTYNASVFVETMSGCQAFKPHKFLDENGRGVAAYLWISCVVLISALG